MTVSITIKVFLIAFQLLNQQMYVLAMTLLLFIMTINNKDSLIKLIRKCQKLHEGSVVRPAASRVQVGEALLKETLSRCAPSVLF